jgi:hypothetical protein
VTLVGPQKILVAAYHGSIVVSDCGMERTITEGNAYNVTFLPSADPSTPAQQPQDSGTGSNGNPSGNGNGGGNQKGGRYGIRNHSALIFTAAVAGVLAGVSYAAWHIATESDSTPHSN